MLRLISNGATYEVWALGPDGERLRLVAAFQTNAEADLYVVSMNERNDYVAEVKAQVQELRARDEATCRQWDLRAQNARRWAARWKDAAKRARATEPVDYTQLERIGAIELDLELDGTAMPADVTWLIAELRKARTEADAAWRAEAEATKERDAARAEAEALRRDLGYAQGSADARLAYIERLEVRAERAEEWRKRQEEAWFTICDHVREYDHPLNSATVSSMVGRLKDERDAAHAEAEALRRDRDVLVTEELRRNLSVALGDLAAAQARAAKLREALEAVVELFEMDAETNTVGTDSWAALHQARAALAEGGET